ncbi:MAG: glycosyl hydrolase family 32, partial [Planctomycetes bacterium]|nr:glycosyl hydrolase family 32 [Planctomycetota bacterium]
LGFSRDGFHFHRPDRRAFLPMSETKGDWNWGNVQSAGGGCAIVGDKLHFYCSGRSGTPENREAGGSTGLAILRRDGFVSLEADEKEGTITTRPITFTGKKLFVNLAAKAGELRVEILDEKNQVIAPFTRADCVAVSGDSTKQAVAWKATDDLSSLKGKTVRFRFHLKNGKLFAFWVSPDIQGSSRGFVAAGGPGYENHRDG